MAQNFNPIFSTETSEPQQPQRNTNAYAQTNLESLESIINFGRIGEGSTLPPPQRGEFRISAPKNFKVETSEFNFAGNLFTLSWLDNEDPGVYVSHYNVYARNFLNSNEEPTLVGSASKSPFHARVIGSASSVIIFTLQPVLQNGITLPLSACSTCTGTVPDATYIFEATDDVTGELARVKIGGDAPVAGGTTVGLWIEFPEAGSPLDTYYTTVGVGGIELNGADTTTIVGGAVNIRDSPTAGADLDVLSSYTGVLSATKVGFYAALDNTGTGAFGDGIRAFIGGDGILGLDSTSGGGDQILFTSQIETTAGAITHYLVVQIDVGAGFVEKRMALYAPS